MAKSPEHSVDRAMDISATDISATGSETIEPQALLKLLLDEERLAILGLTVQRPLTIGEMNALLPAQRTPPAKHVAQLLAAGLLMQSGDLYALDVRQLQEWKRLLFARPAEPVAESSDGQILASFVRGGKIVQIPVQWSKRVVVMGWLATHFEVGRSYAEREVNDILSGHCEDFATLRRYLVDFGLLARQNGIYRRVQEAPTQVKE
jgi:hypothetical protein